MFNIALNTFKEIARHKFLYLILFFAVFFIIFSLFLGDLTIGEQEKIMVDFGLAFIEIFGLIWVLFVGSQLLFNEINGKTIFFILAKPVTRTEFIMWKFLGFATIIFCLIFFQALFFLLMLALESIQITSLILISLVFTFLKMIILLAIVLFLSTFMSHVLTIMSTFFIFLVSHSLSTLIEVAQRSGSIPLLYIGQFFQIIFPPFEALNTKHFIGTFDTLTISYISQNLLYVLIYTALILILTNLIFNRKKLEN